MRLTRTFKVSGLLTAAGILLAAAVPRSTARGRALGVALCVFAGVVFFFSATRALLRGLLWRVGSRLVVSYLLLMSAVVFAAFFVYVGLLVVAGQLGTRRVEAALARRRAAVAALAQELAPRLEASRDAAARARAFAEAAAAGETPTEIGMLWQPKAGPVERAGTQAAPDLAAALDVVAHIVRREVRRRGLRGRHRAAPGRHARPHAAHRTPPSGARSRRRPATSSGSTAPSP